MSDIKERLRDMAGKKYNHDWAAWVQRQCSEAADQIERQEALITELHTSIAGAVQHGEQGWQRYESANKMCLNQQNEIAGLNEVIAELRKDADIYKKKFELSIKFMNKILNFFRPITKQILWERINKFGDEYNSEISRIDPNASTQEVG